VVRLVLLIWGLFGVLKAHKGPLGTPNQYVSDCMCSPSSYVLTPSHSGSNNLDFSGITGYRLTLLVLKLFLPVSGLFGICKANEGPLGTPNQYLLLCMCSPNCYSSIPCHLGLKNLDFSDYKKI
jgi:hypothetical protein